MQTVTFTYGPGNSTICTYNLILLRFRDYTSLSWVHSIFSLEQLHSSRRAVASTGGIPSRDPWDTVIKFLRAYKTVDSHLNSE